MIQWKRETHVINDPDSRGFWTSAERRFDISPVYYGRVNAQSYTVTDNLKLATLQKLGVAEDVIHGTRRGEWRRGADTVRQCKTIAEEWVCAEWESANR